MVRQAVHRDHFTSQPRRCMATPWQLPISKTTTSSRRAASIIYGHILPGREKLTCVILSFFFDLYFPLHETESDSAPVN